MNRFERHPRLVAVGVTGFFFILGLIALEIVLRVTALGETLVNDPWSFATLRHIELREYPPNTTFRFAAPEIRRSSGDKVEDVYSLATDEQGFIKPGRDHANPDVTIAFLGGSTTECLYIDPQERFPVLVGRALEAQLGLKVNVINAARSGSSTQHMQFVFQGKVLPQRPDIVVLMENVNDISILSTQGTYWNNDLTYRMVGEQPRGLVTGLRFVRDGLLGYSYRLIRNSAKTLLGLVGIASAHAQPQLTGRHAEELARQYEASLTQFVYTAQAWGVRPVLMTQAMKGSGDRLRADNIGNYLADARLERRGFSAESFDNTHAYFNEIARYVAARRGAGLIELARADGWEASMMYDGLHLSTPGSRYVADIVTPALAEEIRRLRTGRAQ